MDLYKTVAVPCIYKKVFLFYSFFQYGLKQEGKHIYLIKAVLSKVWHHCVFCMFVWMVYFQVASPVVKGCYYKLLQTSRILRTRENLLKKKTTFIWKQLLALLIFNSVPFIILLFIYSIKIVFQWHSTALLTNILTYCFFIS